ncbi:MAG: DUF58 domain-containing protein [Novosphingobium sp.]|nr:DUF58 domain-containing protein [Novosphingobium sp.]
MVLAAAAPVALVIAATAPGAWIAAPLLGLALLVLIALDAMLAGRLDSVDVVTVPDTEVGEETPLEVRAQFAGGQRGAVSCALEADPRLIEHGRATFDLDSRADGSALAQTSFTPNRRGSGRIENVWLRWSGPMGLGARMVRRPLDQEVRVWPNIGVVRSPALQTFLRDAQFGLIARRMRGEGTQFESLTEYQPGMDRRRIDWKSSARHVHLYAKEYETERNNQIVFAIDCGQAMCEPIDGMPLIDRAVSAALATAYVALRTGDRAAMFGFAARPETMSPFISSTREFYRLQQAAAGLDYKAQEPNFTLAMATLTARLQRRSLIVVFSDFTDPTSAELMLESVARLSRHHLVLFVTLEDAELKGLADAEPADMQTLAMAVTADSLLRQRELVKLRLRQAGADVLEAPYSQIGTRLIDAYLAIKRSGAIG